ncbi:MAG TPA: hypothetical protein DGO89_02740 [Microcoleaceae bacterium UBA9251]|nr:hypothetical protein [Microcoleaceae cyanobacterium UBA9251]
MNNLKFGLFQDLRAGARNRVSMSLVLGDEKSTKKPGFWNLQRGRETGFLRVLCWVTRNLERNPVSEIFNKTEKTQLFQFV